MKETGLLFSAPMVRALLAGTKTQTRRALKLPGGRDPNRNIPGKHAPIEPYTNGKGSWNFVLAETGHGVGDPFPCPYGVPGDRLWVREAWRVAAVHDHVPGGEFGFCVPSQVKYETMGDGRDQTSVRWGRYRHARFMPRWASRITLEITGVRMERLQEISREDAIAEGLERGNFGGWMERPTSGPCIDHSDPRQAYRALWQSINGPGSWDANPFVWCLSFRRVADPPPP